MKNNFKRCLALLMALMMIVGAFAIPVSAADSDCEHTWEKKSTKEPTCTAQGYETWFCTTCQEYEVRNITAKLNHNYVKADKEVLPTCSKDGYPKGAEICSNCSTPKNPVDAKYKADSTLPDFDTMAEPEKWKPADDKFHKWVNPTVSGEACLDAKYDITWTCAHCEKTVKQPQSGKGEHTYSYNVTLAPTCKAEGIVERICSVCEKEPTELKIEKIAHTPGAEVKYDVVKISADKDAHQSYKLCTMCNAKVEKGVATLHDYGTVTIVNSSCSVAGTETRVCNTCKYVDVKKLAKLEHTYNVSEPLKTVKSEHTLTSVVHGYTVYHCTVCDTDFNKYDDAANFNKYGDDHYWEKTTKVDSTCSVAGIQGWKCTVCNTTKNTSIAAGHKLPTDWDSTKHPATCTEDGYKVKVCTLCGYEEKGEKLPSLGNGKHKESVASTDTKKGYKAATCFETGVNIKVCKVCGVVTEKKESAKLTGHTAGKPVVSGYGCFDDKISTTTCDKGCVKVEVILAAQLSHALGEVKTLKVATCFEEGVLGYECSRCKMKTETGKLPFDNDKHVGVQKYSKDVANNKNTDTADGSWPDGVYSCLEKNYEWMYCESCHRNYRRPVTVNNVVTATGTGDNAKIYYKGKYYDNTATIECVSGTHTTYVDVVVMATCYSTGKGTEKCAVPGCTYKVENVVLVSLPHTKGAKEASDLNFTASTCYKQAPWQILCTVCKRVVETGYYDLAKHSLDAGTVTKEATCVATGTKLFKCTNSGCGYTEEETLKKVAHTKSETLAGKPATCTTTGLTETYICKVTGCGIKFIINSKGDQEKVDAQPVIAAKGHTTFAKAFNDAGAFTGVAGKVIAPTCVKNGYTQILCGNGCGVEIGWVDYVLPTGHTKADQNADGKIDAADRFTQEATCTTYEYTYVKCEDCTVHLDKKENTAKPKKAHVNAAGDTLTGDCRLNTLVDYKCKVCGGEFLPTHAYVSENFDECKVTKNTCTVCDKVEFVTYKDKKASHTLVLNEEKSIAATVTSKGVKVEDCVVCGAQIKTDLDKLTAVVFSLEASNPNGGNIVNGGSVYVTVKIDALKIDVNNIRVAVDYDEKHLIFKGAVKSSSIFGALSEPVANAKDGVAYVFDDAGSERNNITIEGKMDFVTLEFYVKPDACNPKNRLGSVVKFVEPTVTELANSVMYYDVTADKYDTYTYDIKKNEKIDLKIDQLGDFDNNGNVNNYDLVAVRDAITNGNAYDAVLDIDHDGEITIKDYKYIKEYMVATYDYWMFADLVSYNNWLAVKDNKVSANDSAKYFEWLAK